MKPEQQFGLLESTPLAPPSVLTLSTGEHPTVDPVLEKIFDFCERAEIGSPTYDPQVVLYKAQDFLKSEWEETNDALDLEDVEQIVDGFADQAFIAINGIYKALRVSGQDPETARVNTNKILDNVAEANLAKGTPDFIYNEFGKVIKPEGWSSPNHSKECNNSVDNT